MVSVDLAQSLMRSGQFEKALHELEACPSVSPDIELNKGLCYAALGRISRARSAMEGLRLSGHDRHAARLAERLAEDAPQLGSSMPGDATSPDAGVKKHALLYVVFAALGALLMLEGVYVGAGLGGGSKSSSPPAGNAVLPSPAQKNAVSGPDESGIRVIDTGLATDTTSLRGRWQSVDFVQNIDDFQPGQAPSRKDLYVRELHFEDDVPASMNGEPSGIEWEPGWVIFNGDHAKAHYAVRIIGGATYLFLPWLNGDVLVGGMRPSYYVLEKVD